jgi:hypothetical protein
VLQAAIERVDITERESELEDYDGLINRYQDVVPELVLFRDGGLQSELSNKRVMQQIAKSTWPRSTVENAELTLHAILQSEAGTLASRKDRVLVRRGRLLDDAAAIFEVHCRVPKFLRARLLFQFEGERGTGSGVNRELFAILAEAIAAIKPPAQEQSHDRLSPTALVSSSVSASGPKRARHTDQTSSDQHAPASASSSSVASAAPAGGVASRSSGDAAAAVTAGSKAVRKQPPRSLSRALGNAISSGPAPAAVGEGDLDEVMLVEGAPARGATFGGAGAGDLFFTQDDMQHPSSSPVGMALVAHDHGLFPLPLDPGAAPWEQRRAERIFRLVGRAMGKAYMDGHVFPLDLSVSLFQAIQDCIADDSAAWQAKQAVAKWNLPSDSFSRPVPSTFTTAEAAAAAAATVTGAASM